MKEFYQKIVLSPNRTRVRLNRRTRVVLQYIFGLIGSRLLHPNADIVRYFVGLDVQDKRKFVV